MTEADSTKGVIALPVAEGRSSVGVYVGYDAEPGRLGWALMKASKRIRGYPDLVAKLILAHPEGYPLISTQHQWSKGSPLCYCHSSAYEGRSDRGPVICHTGGTNGCEGWSCHAETIDWIYRLYPQGIEVWKSKLIDEWGYRHVRTARIRYDTADPRRTMIDVEQGKRMYTNQWAPPEETVVSTRLNGE